MAPALSGGSGAGGGGRRALTAVGNVSPPGLMEEEMGGGGKEMEAMLAELGGAELAPHDLLQAIKTLEGGGEDADAIFPLASFERDLLEPESEGDAPDDKIRSHQARLERRCLVLRRRLRILQARAVGKRVSDEAAQTFERCGRAARREGTAGRPAGLKGLLKRVENTATLQAAAASRPQRCPTYYRVGRDRSTLGSHAASLGVGKGALPSLADTAGALRSDLGVLRRQLDSDATASSSGAESNDEEVTYTNLHQEPMPVEQRALWHWQRARASIAARWTWLQAQIQELEYKIRQHTELLVQMRAAKGPLQFEGEPAPGGYTGPLPGLDGPGGPSTSREDPAPDSCARTRPLRRESFRKRKLQQMHNLHTGVPKAAQPADIRCGCQWPIWGCGVCTGRAVSTQPLPSASTLAAPQRLALVDPGYHPVLSDIHDVSPSVHMAAIASRAWWTGKARSRGHRGSHQGHPVVTNPNATGLNHPHHSSKKKKHSKDKKRSSTSRSSASRRSRDVEDIPSHERGRVRGGGGGGEARPRLNSEYDIDNIVIPHSVAASTRLEILHYKEIPTPKWRVMDAPDRPVLNNGLLRQPGHKRPPKRISIDYDSDDEDTSELSVLARHAKAEQTERGKYVRHQHTRRSHHQNSTESQAPADSNSTGAMSGDDESNPPPEPPHEQRNGALETPQPRRRHTDAPPQSADVAQAIVKPYSPRAFPLADDAYWQMLQAMPRDHPMSTPETDAFPEPDAEEEPLPDVEEEEEEEADEVLEEPPSPLSPLFGEEDDPDDPEWDCTKEKDNR